MTNHAIDQQTHLVSVTGNFISENNRMEATVKFHFEFTIGDQVIPSFDVVTAPTNRKRAPTLVSLSSQHMPDGSALQNQGAWTTRTLANVCYAFIVYFMVIEAMQLLILGPWRYFKDPWNCVDVTMFAVFWAGMSYLEVRAQTRAPHSSVILRSCTIGWPSASLLRSAPLTLPRFHLHAHLPAFFPPPTYS